jgi:hypothetical protein
MCWVQYATPIMILILPFQSIGSNPSTAKGKAKTLQLDYKDYRVDIKNWIVLTNFTMEVFIECSIRRIFHHHHPHERLFLLTVSKQVDKVFMINS